MKAIGMCTDDEWSYVEHALASPAPVTTTQSMKANSDSVGGGSGRSSTRIPRAKVPSTWTDTRTRPSSARPSPSASPKGPTRIPKSTRKLPVTRDSANATPRQPGSSVPQPASRRIPVEENREGGTVRADILEMAVSV